MARRYDPERRQRIIDAAIRLVDERGIQALSHRAVAVEADVPLGSTTYHFAGRDDLLSAALRQVGDEWVADLIAWERGLPADADLADALADLIEQWLSRRSRIELEYELYLSALRHPALYPIAAECLDGLTTLLASHTDEATARALNAHVDGTVLQALLTGRPYDRAATRTALARIIGERC